MHLTSVNNERNSRNKCGEYREEWKILASIKKA